MGNHSSDRAVVPPAVWGAKHSESDLWAHFEKDLEIDGDDPFTCKELVNHTSTDGIVTPVVVADRQYLQQADKGALEEEDLWGRHASMEDEAGARRESQTVHEGDAWERLGRMGSQEFRRVISGNLE